LVFRLAHEFAYPGFTDHYKMLLRSQWKSYDELKAEQEKALRILIRFAYDEVPYYHKLFKSLSLRPEDIRLVEDLEKLPMLTKSVVKSNWEDFKPARLSRMKYVDKATGGSTGTPFAYRMGKQDLMMSICHQIRGWNYLGYEFGDRMVMMGGSSLTMGIRTSASRRLHEMVRNVRILSSFDMTDESMHDYAAIINSYRPKYVFGYSSSLHFFSEWLARNGVNIHTPRAIFTTAERLFPKARASIEKVFGCNVYDSYGLNDGGVSAIECDKREGLHISTERALMEVVNENLHQLSKGNGRILATGLHNFALPFIRYDTGDFATITDDKCSCGRGFKLLKEIQGREQEMLVTPEGKHVHGEFFTHIFWEVVGVQEFQVVQDRIDHLTIKVVPEQGFDRSELEKVRRLVNVRSPGWVIDFKEVDRIDRASSGKYRFVINEVKA